MFEVFADFSSDRTVSMKGWKSNIGQGPQIREQMSGPDLHVFTLKLLALKNWFFPHKKYFPKCF